MAHVSSLLRGRAPTHPPWHPPCDCARGRRASGGCLRGTPVREGVACGRRREQHDLYGLDRRGPGCSGHHDDRRLERRRRHPLVPDQHLEPAAAHPGHVHAPLRRHGQQSRRQALRTWQVSTTSFQLIRDEINLFKWDGTDFTRRFGDPSAVTLSFATRPGSRFGSRLPSSATRSGSISSSKSVPGSSSIQRRAPRTSRMRRVTSRPVAARASIPTP